MDKVKELQEAVAKEFLGSRPGKRHWALMLFETELELGISNNPNKWVNTRNLYYSDGLQALTAYSNIPNPASQLLDGETPEELEKAMLDTLEHFKDRKWLDEVLYPSL